MVTCFRPHSDHSLSDSNDPGQAPALGFPVYIKILAVSFTKESISGCGSRRESWWISGDNGEHWGNLCLCLPLSHFRPAVPYFPKQCQHWSQANNFLSYLRNFRVLSGLVSNQVMDQGNVSLHFYIFIYTRYGGGAIGTYLVLWSLHRPRPTSFLLLIVVFVIKYSLKTRNFLRFVLFLITEMRGIH